MALTLSREQVFRLERPLATFLGLVSGFGLGAVLVITTYNAWAANFDLTPDSSPFLLNPYYFLGFVAALLGLFVWGSLWAIPFEISIGPEGQIRIRAPLRERVYERQEMLGVAKALLVCYRLAVQGDSFLLLPEFTRHEALFAILRRRTAEVEEGGEMADIAYFRSTITPEPGDGPVGWAIAEAVRENLQQAGVDTGDIEPHWDGVKFPCSIGRQPFELEITPYFEATPMKWSVQYRPLGLKRLLPSLTRSARAELVALLDRSVASDHRFELLSWDSLKRLKELRDETR